MPFRFVHTADLHLDSPLASLALRDPGLAGLVGTASRTALSRIVDLCIEEAVDALVIAGDLYDGSETSMKTAGFLAAEMRRLTEAGVRVFLIRGNHDAASRITRELSWPDGVHVFGARDRPETLPEAADGRDVVIHGVSFREPHAPESLLPRYAPPRGDAVEVGLMHTSLGGADGHDSYAPVPPGELAAHGYAYWALGHIHRRTVHRENPAIVMPGMPQGRDIGEAGEKSVTLVSLDGGGRATLETRSVAEARFDRAGIALDGVEDWGEALDRIEAALGSARDACAAPELILRPRLAGATALAWRLSADPALVDAEVRARAGAVGRLWIETVEIACTLPRQDSAAPAGDPLAELAALVSDEIAADPGFRADAGEALAALRRDLPPDENLRAAFATTEEEESALVDTLLTEGTARVLARLRAEGELPQ